jgi:membrane protease YdiL (CAAX protease family)
MWLEIGAIVLLTCAPTLSSVGCSLFWGSEYQKLAEQRRRDDYRTATAFDSHRFESMVVRLRFVPVVLFVMWRSGEGWSRFGLVKPKVRKDILIGLGLWLVVATFNAIIALKLNSPHPWIGLYPVAIPLTRAVLLIGESCVVGFSEELTFRAYLIPRLEAVTGTTWTSVVLSVVLFGFVHLYQGYVGVIDAAVMAVVVSIGFCVTRRIWPIALAHAITDFIVLTHLGATVGL